MGKLKNRWGNLKNNCKNIVFINIVPYKKELSVIMGEDWIEVYNENLQYEALVRIIDEIEKITIL